VKTIIRRKRKRNPLSLPEGKGKKKRKSDLLTYLLAKKKESSSLCYISRREEGMEGSSFPNLHKSQKGHFVDRQWDTEGKKEERGSPKCPLHSPSNLRER